MTDWDKLMDPARNALEALISAGDAMADRIEALTEQLAAARRDAEEAEAYARELEAKLERAVEEAEKYQYAFAAQSRKLQSVLHIDGVRTTLAELTGGKDA